MIADVCNDLLFTFLGLEDITRGMPALSGFLGDDFHTCDLKAHRASVASAILHLENNIFVKERLEEFILLKESYQIEYSTEKEENYDDNGIDPRLRPDIACAFCDRVGNRIILPKCCRQERKRKEKGGQHIGAKEVL